MKKRKNNTLDKKETLKKLRHYDEAIRSLRIDLDHTSPIFLWRINKCMSLISSTSLKKIKVVSLFFVVYQKNSFQFLERMTTEDFESNFVAFLRHRAQHQSSGITDRICRRDLQQNEGQSSVILFSIHRI